MTDDPYRGKGGAYVLIDGKRIPAAEAVKAAKPKKQKSEDLPTEQPNQKEDSE